MSKKLKSNKCIFCGSKETILKNEHYHSGKHYAKTGAEIIIDAHVHYCKNCESSWMTPEESDRIDDAVAKSAWQTLRPQEIASIREALGFKTKTQAARFLGLNYKAFSKLEHGYNETNLSTDLLLRMVVHSVDNFNFVKSLHKKNFEFDESDYELICKQKGIKWAHEKITQQDYLVGSTNKKIQSLRRINITINNPRPALAASETGLTQSIFEEKGVYSHGTR